MTPRISFRPALGENVHIPISPVSSTVELHITATFLNDKEYDDAKRNGLKVQIWSDLPVANRAPGEWGEVSLTDLDDVQPAGTSVNGFNLVPPAKAPRNTVHAMFSVPLSSRALGRYSFTYRLVHASGNVEWLGQYNRNGVLSLDRNDSLVSLDQAWTSKSDGTRLWDARKLNLENVQVAKLSKKVEWTVWSVGQGGKPHRHSHDKLPSQARLLILNPGILSRAVVYPGTLVLSASKDSHISIINTPTGLGITISGNGTMQLNPCYAKTNPHGLVDAVLAHTSHEHDVMTTQLQSCATSSSSVDASVLITSPGKAGSPVAAAVVPLVPKYLPTTDVALTVSSLLAVLPEAKEIAVFGEPVSKAGFRTVDASASKDATLAFHVLSTGSEFAFSEVHSLEGEDWYVSVATAHTLAPAPRIEEVIVSPLPKTPVISSPVVPEPMSAKSPLETISPAVMSGPPILPILAPTPTPTPPQPSRSPIREPSRSPTRSPPPPYQPLPKTPSILRNPIRPMSPLDVIFGRLSPVLLSGRSRTGFIGTLTAPVDRTIRITLRLISFFFRGILFRLLSIFFGYGGVSSKRARSASDVGLLPSSGALRGPVFGTVAKPNANGAVKPETRDTRSAPASPTGERPGSPEITGTETVEMEVMFVDKAAPNGTADQKVEEVVIARAVPLPSAPEKAPVPAPIVIPHPQVEVEERVEIVQVKVVPALYFNVPAGPFGAILFNKGEARSTEELAFELEGERVTVEYTPFDERGVFVKFDVGATGGRVKISLAQ